MGWIIAGLIILDLAYLAVLFYADRNLEDDDMIFPMPMKLKLIILFNPATLTLLFALLWWRTFGGAKVAVSPESVNPGNLI